MVHHLDAHCPLELDSRMMDCENPRRPSRREPFFLGNYTGRWTDTEQGKPIVVVGRFARTIKRKQLLDLRCRMQTAGLLYKTIISYIFVVDKLKRI